MMRGGRGCRAPSKACAGPHGRDQRVPVRAGPSVAQLPGAADPSRWSPSQSRRLCRPRGRLLDKTAGRRPGQAEWSRAGAQPGTTRPSSSPHPFSARAAWRPDRWAGARQPTDRYRACGTGRWVAGAPGAAAVLSRGREQRGGGTRGGTPATGGGHTGPRRAVQPAGPGDRAAGVQLGRPSSAPRSSVQPRCRTTALTGHHAMSWTSQV